MLRLYAGRGEAITGEALRTEIGASDSALKVRVYELRQQIGPGIIESQRGRGDNHGYFLTPKGLSMMLAALERREFQDVRG
jgi:biotin operon repressor